MTNIIVFIAFVTALLVGGMFAFAIANHRACPPMIKVSVMPVAASPV